MASETYVPNSAAMDALPVEILVAIYLTRVSCVGDPPDYEPYHSHLATLLQVSRRWNSIINRLPQIWAVVHLQNQPQVIARALAKSLDCPLIVQGRFTDSSVGGTLAHIYRWSWVDLKPGHLFEWTIFQYPAPLLQQFRITPGYPVRPQTRWQPTNLFDGRSPLLVDVKLYQISLAGTLHASSGLRRLWMSNAKVAFQDFLTTLASCPRLADLTLSDIDLRAGLEQSALWEAPVNLPHLLECRMVKVKADCLDALLGVIIAPRCQRLSLGGRHRIETGSADIPHWQFRNTFRAFPNVLKDTLGLNICWSHNSFECTARFINENDEFRSFNIDIVSHSSERFLDTTFWMLNASGVPDVHLLMEDEPLWGALDEQALEKLRCLGPVVTSLEIPPNDYGKDAARFLRKPLDRGGRQQWIFPNLHTLEVTDSTELLVQFIQERYHSPDPPVALQRLIINDIKSPKELDARNKLSGMLGEDVVQLRWISNDEDSE